MFSQNVKDGEYTKVIYNLVNKKLKNKINERFAAGIKINYTLFHFTFNFWLTLFDIDSY